MSYTTFATDSSLSELLSRTENMTTLRLDLGERGYDITIGKNILSDAGKLMKLDRKVFIVTDSGVPREYAEAIAKGAKSAVIYTVDEGEGSKSLPVMEKLLSAMLEFEMSRKDCAVAVGGGVVGDLTGFAASTYMRGIDFYNVPTTLLSQVDSSIGGKTAVNLCGIKNVIGAFYQPKAVLIDTDTLKTLPKRQIAAGLAEAVKMSLTSNEELFRFFEEEEISEKNIEYVIKSALEIKKTVVECDERESGLRKILNFGHTFGHGIEAEEGMSGLYHGECVALGMLPMCSPELEKRLLKVLSRLGLPTEYKGDVDRALSYVVHDKKSRGGMVEVIFVDEPGSFRIENLSVADYSKTVKEKLFRR